MSLSLRYLQVLLDSERKQLFTIILKSILTLLKCLASPTLRGILLIFKCRSYLLNTPLPSPAFFSEKPQRLYCPERYQILLLAPASLLAPAFLKADIRLPAGKQSKYRSDL